MTTDTHGSHGRLLTLSNDECLFTKAHIVVLYFLNSYLSPPHPSMHVNTHTDTQTDTPVNEKGERGPMLSIGGVYVDMAVM